jgi:hypothetical protein
MQLTDTVRLAAMAITAFAIAPTNVFADAFPINPDGGVLAISGVNLGVTTTPFCISWAGGSTCAGATHGMTVGGSSTDFSTAVSATDQIKDLSGTGAVTDFEEVLGGAFLGGATVHFDLTSLVTNGGTALGNCNTTAPFNSCTPANSPFTYTENSNSTQVTISFEAMLNGYTGTSAGGTTAYDAKFSTQIAGVLSGTGACGGLAANIVNIVTCESSGGTLDVTWAANETPIAGTVTPTPEPASCVLFGSVLAAAALFGRRRANSRG